MTPQELDGLLAAHFAGTLDAEGQKLLGEALLADESARRRFVELADQEAALRALTQAQGLTRAVEGGGLKAVGTGLGVGGGRLEAKDPRATTSSRPRPATPNPQTPALDTSLPPTSNPQPPTRRRSGWLLPAAAAAALIVVSGLFAFGVLPSGNVTIKKFGNTTDRVVEEKLSDGTRLAIAPGAKLVAAGRDEARRVRQLIKLESGEVEVTAPKAPAGEVACRVETPEGLWVETVGTVFKVTRAWENEKGERNVDKSKLAGAAITAVLLVAVNEGEVRTGRGRAEEARVAEGHSSVVRAAEAGQPASVATAKAPADLADRFREADLVFVGSVVKADLTPLDLVPLPGGLDTTNIKFPNPREVQYQVARTLKGAPGERLKVVISLETTYKTWGTAARPYEAVTPQGDRSLDPGLFKAGAQHLVLMRKPAGGGPELILLCPATAEALAAIDPENRISWGQAVGDGLRLGVSPPTRPFASGQASFRVTFHWENTGQEAVEAPVFRPYTDSNLTGLQLAGRKGGEAFSLDASRAASALVRSQMPGSRTLKPGERFSEDLEIPFAKSALYQPPALAEGESLALRFQVDRGLKLDPPKAQPVVTSGDVTLLGAAKSEEKVSWGQAVNGLQGRIEAEKSTVAPGEDIKLTFWLRTGEQQKESLYVWDNIYSNGFRNDSYQVKLPDGKEVRLQLPAQNNWDKNSPHPVEIKPGAPWKLGGWAGEVNVKSLKELGLNTDKLGTYTITGGYEETAVDAGKAFSPRDKGIVVWGGKLTTPPIEVQVEAAGAAPTFSAKCQRPADKVAAEAVVGALTLTVTSPGGIGSAEVKLETGGWPKKIVVRLALKGLEGFTAECGGKKLTGGINGSGAKVGDLAAEKKGELIEVALPEGFASGADAVLKLSWVDFYR